MKPSWQTNGWLQHKSQKFGFCTDTTAVWPMGQA